jgi:hypothetical protein
MNDWEREVIERMSLCDFLRDHLSPLEREMLQAYIDRRGGHLARILRIPPTSFYRQVQEICARLRQHWMEWEREE